MMQIEQQYLNLNVARMNQPPPETTVPPPPVVICPTEVDNVNITLERNQQCACKDCGKLFNSVWYLKQHAVKHSNDRPFRCKFCYKTYKFRSNLYQHKCPDRIKNGNSPLSRRLMCRFTVNQPPQLCDARSASIQQSPHRIVPSEISHLFRNGQNFLLPFKPAGLIRFPIITAPEALTTEEKQQQEMELREVVVPKRSLEQAVIDNYLQKYKHKLYQCRKCKLQFPTRGYLSRHNAQHSELDQLSLQCDFCPQRFSVDVKLRKHIELHSNDSGILCTKCCSSFRSMLALRRHRNQSRQCDLSSSTTSIFGSQSTDEYAYIDAVEAIDQMDTTTITNSTSGEEQFAPNDENGGCETASSSTDCYQHYSPILFKSGDGDNEDSLPSYENDPERPITTVKIKLGSKPVASILKKEDIAASDERSVNKNRMTYAELGDMEEVINSEAVFNCEPSRRLLSLTSGFDISTTSVRVDYNSYIHSDHNTTTTTRNYAGISDNVGIVSCTQMNSGNSGKGIGSDALHFTSSVFYDFSLNSNYCDISDGLVLEGGQPLTLQTYVHTTKAHVASQPVAELIAWTESIHDEIGLCETLCTVQTHFLRRVVVYIVCVTVLQIVSSFGSICQEHKKLSLSLLAIAATAAVPSTETVNSLQLVQLVTKYAEIVVKDESDSSSGRGSNASAFRLGRPADD